jgi:hypothetical protein
MRTSVFISIVAAAMLAAAVTASYAQDKGSSGMNGGAKDQPSQSSGNGQPAPSPATTGQKVEIRDAAEAKDQPTIATGADLNGSAVQLAPSKTPE